MGRRRLADCFRDVVQGNRTGVAASLIRWGLQVLSWPYGWAVSIRNALYDLGWLKAHSVGAPVVSVGNLTLGGTGKTPCVEYVARRLRASGRMVVLLSRGYGAAAGRNDEALLLEENLPDVPHLLGADRVALATIAIEELESDALILDDGFQHRRLARDLDIVLVDATDPWGGNRLFPRGLLREHSRNLRRADIVVLTRCDQAAPETVAEIESRVQREAPKARVFRSRHQPRDLVNSRQVCRGVDTLRSRDVFGFCGIGNPQAFRSTLEQLGRSVTDFRAFPDHHPYSREDVEDLLRWAASQPADALAITTQKDLVKLGVAELAGRELWALRIEMEILAREREFAQAIEDARVGESAATA